MAQKRAALYLDSLRGRRTNYGALESDLALGRISAHVAAVVSNVIGVSYRLESQASAWLFSGQTVFPT